MSLKPTAISAPGKVLLAGGFIVLDRAYSGLVFGLSARIHVHVEAVPATDGVTLSEVVVRSPQFLHALWEYSYRQAQDDGGMVVTQLRANSLTVGADTTLLRSWAHGCVWSSAATQVISRNPFIETALSYALTYVSSVAPAAIHAATITVLADKDYYSTASRDQAAPATSDHAGFVDFGTPLNKTNKTGLGSSAALVTAFIAALLTHYLSDHGFSVENEAGRRQLHNLAQAAHCAAQGKVGSGFDVASAVYGSCLYRRFSPSILERSGEPGTPNFGCMLQDLVGDAQKRWDTKVDKSAVTIPKGVRLVMCDVDCGSETPGMVRKVLAWRKEKGAEAEQIWKALQKANEALAAELVRLSKDVNAGYDTLRQCILDIRVLVRRMSSESDVPIEPPSQTRLLDECSALPGVIGGVVPGAGGFDAAALLIEDRPEVLASLQKYLANRSDTALGEGKDELIGRVSLLGVRQEMEGVRTEGLSQYKTWV